MATVRILCRQQDSMSLADVNGTVVLTSTDSNNHYQHWSRVETGVQDSEGRPAFALKNKATGKFLKHSFGHGYPVRLLRTNQKPHEDPSLIWVALPNPDAGSFHGICMVNNLQLGFDVSHNRPLHVLYLYLKKFEGKDNQLWKMEPWESLAKSPSPAASDPSRRSYYGLDGPTKKIVCRANRDLTLAVRDGRVVLSTPNRMDVYQHWILDARYCTMVKDTDGCWPLSFVNKGSGRALKHSLGNGHPARLVPYNPDFMDESIMWSGTKRDWGEGFNCIRMINNINSVLSTVSEDRREINDGVEVILSEWKEGENQLWRFYSWE
uniref:Ricin B lectin domain-containing protein n=1 Tax=Oryza meridionalis TaxID=40149 RepID=A0A0E0CKT0_9ORYZ